MRSHDAMLCDTMPLYSMMYSTVHAMWSGLIGHLSPLHRQRDANRNESALQRGGPQRHAAASARGGQGSQPPRRHRSLDSTAPCG